MLHLDFEQGSPEWLEARRGVITGSRFRDARDRSDGLTEQQRAYVAAIRRGCAEAEALAIAGYKKSPTAEGVQQALAGRLEMQWGAKALGYAMDLARERCGGKAPDVYQNAAMRAGTEQEPIARAAYERRTGALVEPVGFFKTDDGLFGLSPDGLIDDDGVLEIKTMVSSDTFFTAVVNKDLSEYVDQCNGYLWLLGRQWVDLVLWAPDMAELGMALTIHRIARDEAAIEKLEADLMAFAKTVTDFETKLRKAAPQLEHA